MIFTIIIHMKVPPEKRKELTQTISSLTGSIKSENGCRRCEFFQNLSDENILCLLEEWDTMANLEIHLKSENLMVLRGAMNLLVKPWEMLFFSSFNQSAISQKDLL
ncbi:MAG: hypothetical protein A2511_11925 [Deltaproteobacteria bacterium RIFOXYD12_FULL_50_9]|nr:MAG: hypothetical protein A2511_11925 [Deltaproteobacteria bacterium RIFOXYD12_FULL_50_9]